MSPRTEHATEPSSPVRVLALIDHFAQGGAETLLSRFALGAPGAGIDLSISYLEERDGSPAAAPLRAHGIEAVNLDLAGRPGLRSLRAVRAHIARVEPQLVHTHLGSSDLLGGLSARSLGLPMVSTIHTTLWGTRWRDPLLRRVVGACADRIIAVSDSAREEYMSHWGWGRRVVTIYNGIDVEVRAGTGQNVRARLGIAPADPVIVMASALRPEKGHQIAIQALRGLLPIFPGLRLVIVGRGASAQSIADCARDLGGAVSMVGFTPDVMPFLDAADICLQPSLHEAFPTTLLEAMAAGTPIVATGVGGIPEIITDSTLGVLIPSPPTAGAVAEAVAGLLHDPQRRRALAATGRRAYEQRFTAGPWIQRTRRLYDEVIAERCAEPTRRAGARASRLGVRTQR